VVSRLDGLTLYPAYSRSGIAGALAERVPVLHIVGSPSTSAQVRAQKIDVKGDLELIKQSDGTLLHHTLNLPTSFQTFSKMSEPLSCSQAILSRVSPVTPTTWTDELDRVIKDVLQQCRPGYVEIPTDAVHHKVSSAGLETRLVSSCYTLASAAQTDPGSPTPIPHLLPNIKTRRRTLRPTLPHL
jgi:TPP-dependent 2-oxoacid decarboxylase